MKKFLSHVLVFVALFSFGVMFVHAQAPVAAGTIPNPFNCGGASSCTLGTFLNYIILNLVMPLGGILAVLAFIWVGFMFVKARGNESEIEKAKRALLYVAIGTAVLLGASLISSVVSNTVNQL